MSYTFKSKAAGDITMTQADAEQLLRIIGKTPAAEGIIEVAAENAAIQALEDAASREQANRALAAEQVDTQLSDAPDEEEPVQLHQRIWPLVEMLKRAREAHEVVVWGV